MLQTLVAWCALAVLSCCLYLLCGSTCSSQWSSDVIMSTLMLAAACVSLQGADCDGILSPTSSAVPTPPSIPYHPASIFDSHHDWVWHSHKPWRLPAGHCPFSCRTPHIKKDHTQMQPQRHLRECYKASMTLGFLCRFIHDTTFMARRGLS